MRIFPASMIEFFSIFDLLKIKVVSLWVWPIVKFRAFWGAALVGGI